MVSSELLFIFEGQEVRQQERTDRSIQICLVKYRKKNEKKLIFLLIEMLIKLSILQYLYCIKGGASAAMTVLFVAE